MYNLKNGYTGILMNFFIIFPEFDTFALILAIFG